MKRDDTTPSSFAFNALRFITCATFCLTVYLVGASTWHLW